MDDSTSTNSIYPHAVSSSKKDMATRKNLETHREDGNEEQGRTSNLQPIPSTIQEESSKFLLYQCRWNTKCNDDSCGRLPDLHIVQEEKEAPQKKKKKKKKKKKNKTKKEEEIFACALPVPTSRSDCLLGNGIGANQHQKTSKNDQCIMKIRKEKDQCSVRSISCGTLSQQEERSCQSTTDERLLLSIPKRSECKSDQLGLLELRRSESMDCNISMEVGSSTQISHDRSLDKNGEGIMPELPNLSELVDVLKNDKGHHEVVADAFDKTILDPENRKYFCETFDINGLCPLFVDHSGMAILMLDSYGFLFQYEDMGRNLYYLGNNLRDGLINFIYHPNRICVVMEFTCELVSSEELSRRSDEVVSKLSFLKWENRGFI